MSRRFLRPREADELADLSISLGVSWLMRASHSYTAQLCGQGGTAILEEAMKTATLDSYLLVGACASRDQDKLFKKPIRAIGFNDKHFVPVDIRGADNKGYCESFPQRRCRDPELQRGSLHPDTVLKTTVTALEIENVLQR